MNPGIKTTEFWTTVISTLALGGGVVPDKYSVLVTAISGVYVASRTLLKVVQSLGEKQ
jgi:hypothetical protein